MAESFLKRWSRLKHTADTVRVAPAQPPPAAAKPEVTPLPALDSLGMSSDFLPFMQGEVAEGVRRVALQKLFAAEHFNIMDGLDVYIDDYNKFEPIGEEMLQQLMQAPGLLNDLAEAGPKPETAGGETEADVKPGSEGEPE